MKLVRTASWVALFMVVLVAGSVARADEAAAPPGAALAAAPVPAPRKLIVGTTPVSPFIIKNADGTFSGISIEVFQLAANAMGQPYEIKELTREQLVGGQHDADVVVSLNIGPSSEKTYDMSHAFYTTGLAIAVSNRGDAAPWWRSVLGAGFAKTAALLLALLLLAGIVMWLLERKRNEEEFGGPMGIVSGLFWAVEAVVGYNDPQHKTRFGRLFGITWAFAGVILISSVTAKIAAEMTASKLVATVQGPADLPRVKVGVVRMTQAFRYCERRRLSCAVFEDTGPALEALARGEVEAVVGEAPIVRDQVQKAHASKVTVLAGTFENHGYGFGIKPGSHDLREALNRALLEASITEPYSAIFTRYLGSAD